MVTDDDKFIAEVDRAIGLLADAFANRGMTPPTSVIIQDHEDAYKLKGVRPSMTFTAPVRDAPDGVLMRIHGVAFRLRPNGSDW